LTKPTRSEPQASNRFSSARIEAVQKNDPDQGLATVRSKLGKKTKTMHICCISRLTILNQKRTGRRQHGISIGFASVK